MKKIIKLGLSLITGSSLICGSCIPLVSCNQSKKESSENETFEYKTIDYAKRYVPFNSKYLSIESDYPDVPILSGKPTFVINDDQSPFYGARYAFISHVNDDGYGIYATFIGWSDEDFSVLEQHGWDLTKVRECMENYFNGTIKWQEYINIPKYIRFISKDNNHWINWPINFKSVFLYYGIKDVEDVSKETNNSASELLYNDLPNRDIDFDRLDETIEYVSFFNRTHKNQVIKYDKDFKIIFPDHLKQVPYLETYDYGPIDINITLDFSSIDSSPAIASKNPEKISLFSTKLSIIMHKFFPFISIVRLKEILSIFILIISSISMLLAPKSLKTLKLLMIEKRSLYQLIVIIMIIHSQLILKLMVVGN